MPGAVRLITASQTSASRASLRRSSSLFFSAVLYRSTGMSRPRWYCAIAAGLSFSGIRTMRLASIDRFS